MKLTPERFIEMAWSINLSIISADKDLLGDDFIEKTTILAEKEGIDVLYLDFSSYESIEHVLTSTENTAFFDAIQSASKPTLLWFDNCDMLAPLDCNFTYRLRSVLTTRFDGVIQSVFIARNDSLKLMFTDSKAAFYQNSMRITDR
ncbi:hypothetical protein PVK63_01400 [Aliivibrio sp. S2TY2]|uniref:hypothetical protein n=1 Tax=unclassified Aliivibrio TaxID=2645654 RepID=UPI002378898D|nr:MULTISPECIES: hypothetical protein [unclassified Aliivibrio]MDD9173511.1 hypothetical protein [Aliivibrio sp. S3TY1]MDD9190587.1 hypothetical protein [Aliivibrio sp. S2TY2]